MDYLGLLAIGLISFFSTLAAITIGLKVGVKWLEESQFFEDLTKNILESVSNDAEMQKLIYQLGGLFGSGVKGGIGIDLPVKQRGGKFKLQDIILDLASQYFTQGIRNPAAENSAHQPSPVNETMHKRW